MLYYWFTCEPFSGFVDNLELLIGLEFISSIDREADTSRRNGGTIESPLLKRFAVVYSCDVMFEEALP